MEVRYSGEYTNEEVDEILTSWAWLYILACTKYGNYKYEDRFKVVSQYIKQYYDYDYTQYVIDLRKRNDLQANNELFVLKRCEKFGPLFFMEDMQRYFKIKKEYFEERLKYNFYKLSKQILKRD